MGVRIIIYANRMGHAVSGVIPLKIESVFCCFVIESIDSRTSDSGGARSDQIC